MFGRAMDAGSWAKQEGGVCRLRFNWVTFSYRYKTLDTYFGTSFYTLDTTGPQPLITRKSCALPPSFIYRITSAAHR